MCDLRVVYKLIKLVSRQVSRRLNNCLKFRERILEYIDVWCDQTFGVECILCKYLLVHSENDTHTKNARKIVFGVAALQVVGKDQLGSFRGRCACPGRFAVKGFLPAG